MKRINMKRYKLLRGICAVMILTVSCETTELEILDNPNAVSPDQSSVDFFLNSIQSGAIAQFEGIPLNNVGLSELGMEVTRMMQMAGPTYQNAYAPTFLNQVWTPVYSGALPDIRTMIPVAEEQGLYTHVGIAKVLEAMMMINMVDFFGDVPYSEATDGVNFPNPDVDSGEEIYAKMLNLIDEALLDFAKEETALPASDRFYGGDEALWVKFANTLKLKIYVQTRLVDSNVAAINQILVSGDYIKDSSEDFEVKWSATDTNPDSRHPEFGANFDNGTAEYMNTTYMYWMVEEKGMMDPRARYYFYRQVSQNTTDVNEQSCITEFPPAHFGPEDIYCNFSNEGYWGRIHGDNDGIPPDRAKRTTFGLYPVGGLFDNDSFISITGRNISTQGAGISPIMLSSYVDFMLAEAALFMGTSGNPRDYLENGIRKSMEKVINFSPANVDPDYAASQQDIDDYLTLVLDTYDAASNDEERMAIIAKEYMIALWGNGVEAYNTYRRTGQPYLQPTEIAQPGPFIRSFLYPAVFVDQNSNVAQKADVSSQVFWDNNPAGFVN
nr:SusD/RagB family nutrient-binding outer membrane lipoprotein [Allomuricauda sp.]